MNKIRVIDLLNKIANRETTYDYIEYWNRNKDKYDVMLVCEENLIYKLNNGDILLTDEVNRAKGYEEEPQEHKIPDKIFLNQDYGSCYIDPYSYKQVPLKREKLSPEEVSIINKINEILDYLEEKE